MKNEILGDKKKRRYDEGLIDVVNRKAERGELGERVVSEGVDLSKIEFESARTGMELDYYTNLEHVKLRKYSRFPRPGEYFTAIDDELKNGEDSEYFLVLPELFLQGSKEWTSACAEVSQDERTVKITLDPELIFNIHKNKYEFVDSARGSHSKIFNLRAIIHNDLEQMVQVGIPIPLTIYKEICPDIITYLYGQKYESLNRELKMSWIQLPCAGELAPFFVQDLQLKAVAEHIGAFGRGVRYK